MVKKKKKSLGSALTLHFACRNVESVHPTTPISDKGYDSEDLDGDAATKMHPPC